MAVFDCSNISLQRGSTGEKVKTLQTHLKTLGYYTRQIDGSFGSYTFSAVKQFQSAYKLTVDGVFGPQSCKKLNEVVESQPTSTTEGTISGFDCPNISLRRNSKGADVTKLQTMLKALGYYTRQIDDDFGVYTEQAVKAYQKSKGHDPDGWFGPKTCKTLNELYSTKVGTSLSDVVLRDTTPEERKKITAKLTLLPDVVVLPTTEFDDTTMTKTVTEGSIDTETNFNCTTINLNKGSKGEEVKKLQTVLKARGYYTRQIDGDYGTYTVNAVKRLQQAQGNSPDGNFGPKTCAKLQANSTTSNTATGTSDKKNTNYVINDITSFTTNDDIEGISHEITVKMVYSQERINHIRKLQKSQFDMYFGTDVIHQHEGYVNDVKVTHEDSQMMLELQLVGYTAFLDLQLESYEKTDIRSMLIKDLCELAGLKANVDTTGLDDSEFTVKVVQAAATSTGGGGGLVEVHGNDCTPTNPISARSFDIDECYGNTKIGDSTANYAQDTANMSAKEAILDVYNRFHYGPSLTSSAVYNNNRRCPQQMWTKTGKFWGNCADISRLVKAVGEVHGLKVGIRHCPSHYYNLIEVNGKVYRFDCCFSSGYTGRNYGSELCNNLTKNGGPWQS